MKSEKELNLVALGNDDLISIEGGKNLLEYVAMGIGFLVGAVVGGAESLDEWSGGSGGVRFPTH